MFNGFRSLGYLDNFNKIPSSPWISATGGTETTYSASGMTYKVHTFTTVGNNTFTVNELGTSGTTIDALLVAGGGGSSSYAGAGGAGGMLEWTAKAITAGTYNVYVGAGGTANSLGLSTGNGGNSGINNSNGTMFGGAYAVGGGAGGDGGAGGNYSGQAGGSGGGGAGNSNGDAYGGNGTVGQGYAGGNAPYSSDPKNRVNGPGGGAGGSPAYYVVCASYDFNGNCVYYINTPTGAPGPGKASSITGTSITYATGGNPGINNPSTANTGNGANSGGSGASGGSGIVVIRYRIA